MPDRVAEPARCAVAFDTVDDFRAQFRRGKTDCFVPWPDELDAGRAVIIDLAVSDRATLELAGTVTAPDFDERGNIGVLVALAKDSADELDRADAQLSKADAPAIFGTTRLHKPRTLRGLDSATPRAPGDVIEELLLEPGTTIDERFRVEAHLATGGMGEVYRANHIHLKRPVALKLLRKEFAADADMWARFQREAELVSQLESPHVVRVFDFGRTASGQPYLAMEYVEGQTLDVEIGRGPLEPARAVELLVQVCTGLAEAHALGVIHRDLKPANLISGKRRDGSEVVKILDFGIARLGDAKGVDNSSQKLTRVGIVVGTPAYLAPEQALADELDVRTDVYAMGCVAYELLTGAPPFVSSDLHKVISMHLTAAPMPLAQRRPELARFPALEVAVLRALSKERDRRFPTAQEFAAALSASVATTQPPSSSPSLAAVPAPAPGPEGDDLWPPPAPVASSAPVDTAAVDDFFGATPIAAAPAAPAPTAAATAAKKQAKADAAPAPKEPHALRALRAVALSLPDGLTRAAFVFAEVLGVPPGSVVAQACAVRMAECVAAFGGFLDTSDEDGLTFGFATRDGVPAARAALATLAMRDAVADEAVRSNAPARLRAALAPGSFPDGDLDGERRQPRSHQVSARLHTLVARAQAGQVVCDKSLAQEAGPSVELQASPTPDVLVLAARRPPRRAAPELLGRATALELLDRRLQGLTQGVVAPLIVQGPSGSGRTALATELAVRARARSQVVATATAASSWKQAPCAAITALLCGACGIAVESRARLLRPALEALKVPGPVIEAAMVISGVHQAPWPFTAGQVAHALRSVLRAGAADRHVVLVFDGLERFDEQSLEAFTELVTRPAARELTIGFTSEAVARDRLGGATTIELAPLDGETVKALASSLLGVAPGPRLTALLTEDAQGLPGRVVDLVALLEARGALRGGEVVDDVPSVDGPLMAARLEVLPVEQRRVLEAARCCGESFEATAVMVAWPRATQPAFQALGGVRLVAPLTVRRWAFSSPGLADLVVRASSAERQGMHQRLALALVEKGRSDPASVDTFEVAGHFLRAGDGVKAVALYAHAAEQALTRRAPREAAAALKGRADALALQSGDHAAHRAEALARAAALSLSCLDAAQARVLVDEAVALDVESAELSLSLARVLRSEARRARAAEALERARALGGKSPLGALLDVERAETCEQEGDAVGAMVAFEGALVGAQAAATLARWHGEVDLVARVEARLAALNNTRKDFATARRLLESSATRWHQAGAFAAQARALSNLGSVCAQSSKLADAGVHFAAAAQAAEKAGDFLFQAKALLQYGKVLKKTGGAQLKPAATEARRLAVALGWEQGRDEASTLLNS
jgi:serine/threonine-protein kinase